MLNVNVLNEYNEVWFVGVIVGVIVGVTLFVGVIVVVTLGVGVTVFVGVTLFVGVIVLVGVTVFVGVIVVVGVILGVTELVGVIVLVGVTVVVGVTVLVGVGVKVAVGVGVGSINLELYVACNDCISDNDNAPLYTFTNATSAVTGSEFVVEVENLPNNLNPLNPLLPLRVPFVVDGAVVVAMYDFVLLVVFNPSLVIHIKCQAVSAAVVLLPTNASLKAIFILDAGEPHNPIKKSGEAVLAFNNLPAVPPSHL